MNLSRLILFSHPFKHESLHRNGKLQTRHILAFISIRIIQHDFASKNLYNLLLILCFSEFLDALKGAEIWEKLV